MATVQARRASGLLLLLLPVLGHATGILYPDTYPTPDQENTAANCNNGESFLTDAASFLKNETNAVQRFLVGFDAVIPTDAIRRSTVACLGAELHVSSDVPAAYAKGLFAAAGTYKALVRVNSKNETSGPPGMRMSVKIFGLNSMDMMEPVGPNDDERGTMDMIFEPIAAGETSLETIAAANQRGHATGMVQIAKLLESRGITSRRLDGEMLGDDMLPEASDSAGSERSLSQGLSEVMFNMNMGTMAATRFGTSSEPAAKLFWKRPAFGVPCQDTGATGADQYGDCLSAIKPAFERALMKNTLDFPIYANLQGCNDMLEASSVAWSTDNIQQVALLVVKTSQDESTCDNLAYTPWHGLKAHKPLGSMQRTRKDSYYAAAVSRTAQVGAAPTFPANPAGPGILYPNTYPTPDQQPTGNTCSNGEMYLTDSSSFLDGERNAVERFLLGWKGSLSGDAIRRTTVACLAAHLEVNGNVDAAYKKGLFAAAGTYPALVRVNSNTGEGMRMSVKVFGLDGMEMLDPVGPNDLERGTMDMIFEPIASSGDSLEVIAAANQRSAHASGISQITALLSKKGITSRRLSPQVHTDDNHPEGSRPTASLRRLQGQSSHSYNMNMGTGAAIRFGGSTEPAAKLFWTGTAFSVDCLNTTASGEAQYAPCLTAIKPAFEQALSQGSLNFPIYANLQACGDRIEASGTAWSTGSIAQVATLMVKESRETSMCDNLAFTPWHGLKAHKPLGNMQRVRKDSYYAAAVARGAVMGVAPFSESTSFASPASAFLRVLLMVPIAVASWLCC